MKRRPLRAILLSLVTASVLSSTALASDTVIVENEGSIGAVDIALDCEVEGNTEALLPGETIFFRSTITNKAEPAWIRAKISYPKTANTNVLDHLGDADLTELDDGLVTLAEVDWVKIGSYYYRTSPVLSGKTVAFTEQVQFPTDWDNRLVSSRFGICVQAEAIQETNFTPDFESDDPWHGAVIEAYDSTDYLHKEEGNERFSIRYENGAEGLVRVGKNFFANWETLMPGDTVTGEASIENKMAIPVKLYFSINPVLRNTVKDEHLLSALGIKIIHGGQTIYDGNLMEPLPEILLKEYAQGESETLSYELTVPKSLTNEFAELDFSTIWTFRAVPNPSLVRETVLTGEAMKAGLFIGCLCLMAGSFVLWKKGRRKRA